jgi:hypothetical protein
MSLYLRSTSQDMRIIDRLMQFHTLIEMAGDLMIKGFNLSKFEHH